VAEDVPARAAALTAAGVASPEAIAAGEPVPVEPPPESPDPEAPPPAAGTAERTAGSPSTDADPEPPVEIEVAVWASLAPAWVDAPSGSAWVRAWAAAGRAPRDASGWEEIGADAPGAAWPAEVPGCEEPPAEDAAAVAEGPPAGPAAAPPTSAEEIG
jgi:hypothetical protein